MRKVITFVMIMIMIIFYASVLAEPAFTGAWATVRDLDNAITEIIILRVFSDNNAFYSRQQFTTSSIGEEEKGIYTWESDDNRAFRLISDTGEILGTYSLINDKRLMAYNDMFARIDFYARETQTPEPYTEPTPSGSVSGITVPSGVYIAGEDFQAGTYRIELENEKNGGVIVLYENMEDTKKAFSYLHEYSLSKNNTTVGKMIIEDGNVLDVRNTVVILLPYEGIK